MYLSNLLIINYRSCKELYLDFQKDDPNIFIGINDCGKTTILKAIGLLLEDKSIYHFVKENSSKKDFSNSPISKDSFDKKLLASNIAPFNYEGSETIIIGRFRIENDDIDLGNLATYTPQLLWAIENSANSELLLAKVFNVKAQIIKTLLLMPDHFKDTGGMKLWDAGVRELDKTIKEMGISSEDITNTNGQGRFSNLEKIRAIYSKLHLDYSWTDYKIEKGDKTVFPGYRYLDWNSSLEDIKKTATDAMAVTIEAQLKPLRQSAAEAARKSEEAINKQLQSLQTSIAQVMPNITAIKTTVFVDVKESVTDILINKKHADGDIHLDLQGEGVKRQIWFALIKSGAMASIQSGVLNKKFIWAFDEPETHLYPSAQRQFFEIIKEVSKSNIQTFICTHSTVFIDKSKLNNIKSVQLAEDSYSYYSECLTADEIFNSLELRNSDFLFYDKFLIIEGDTELYLMPELYRIYKEKSLSDDNIQLINLTGKSKWIENKKALENVMAGFKKSFDYIIYLFDSDMKRELGANAITDKFFFVGKQDAEDSFLPKQWVELVDNHLKNEIQVTEADVLEIIVSIPTEGSVGNHEKFYSQLERLVKDKLSQVRGEQITYSVLPAKGNDLAQLLLSTVKSKEDIPQTIKDAFDKLQIVVPIVEPIEAEGNAVVAEQVNGV